MRSKRALHETAKITKISKFCKAFDEKANEVNEGPRQSRKNYEKY